MKILLSNQQNKSITHIIIIYINRSLLSLGNCINALAEAAKGGSRCSLYVPYRDSKLTRILKNSLGGNCRTVMLAAISPSAVSYEDTMQTLKYADRARSIRTLPKANITKKEERRTHYVMKIAHIKKQIKCLEGSVSTENDIRSLPHAYQKMHPQSQNKNNQKKKI